MDLNNLNIQSDKPQNISPVTHDQNYVVKLSQISLKYGDFLALDDVFLEIPKGKIGLLGPNGAGKSTLLKMILGLITPTKGEGLILGQNIAGMKNSKYGIDLRKKIGFMPEADALVPGLTGVEYVCLAGELSGMPRKHAERRAHEVLSYLQMEEARYRSVEQYSIGMKQRVKLAQALVHDPILLLLDEPTSGLDPSGRDAMLKLIRELGDDHGKSIILSTHLLADVQSVCDHVVIMAGGKVRGQGKVNELCSVRQNQFRLKVQGDSTAFKNDLLSEGVEFLESTLNGEWRVKVPEGWSNLAFFKLADLNSCAIRSLTRDDESLEELFLRFIKS